MNTTEPNNRRHHTALRSSRATRNPRINRTARTSTSIHHKLRHTVERTNHRRPPTTNQHRHCMNHRAHLTDNHHTCPRRKSTVARHRTVLSLYHTVPNLHHTVLILHTALRPRTNYRPNRRTVAPGLRTNRHHRLIDHHLTLAARHSDHRHLHTNRHLITVVRLTKDHRPHTNQRLTKDPRPRTNRHLIAARLTKDLRLPTSRHHTVARRMKNLHPHTNRHQLIRLAHSNPLVLHTLQMNTNRRHLRRTVLNIDTNTQCSFF